MSANVIESVEYGPHNETDEPIIEIQIKELFSPCLIGTSHCTKVTIWWDTQASAHDEAVKVYAIEEIADGKDMASKEKSFYDFRLKEAMAFVKEELT